jgi:predicted Zn-dependent protease
VSSPSWVNAAASWSGLNANYVLTTSSYDVYALNENRGNTVVWTGVTRKKGTIQSLPTCTGGYMTSGQVEVVMNWSLVSGYSSSKKQGLAAHELGHAFGLNHVTSTNILMYGADTRTVTTPQADDKAGVNALY